MLLLDENLSPKLAGRLEGLFLSEEDGSRVKHVLHVGLDNDEDDRIWEFAKRKGYAIVTKDKDYIDFSLRHGHPPKVVLLTIGNCRLTALESFLKTNLAKIIAFLDDQDSGLLKL